MQQSTDQLSSLDNLCPKCRRGFNNSRAVLSHLTSRTSSCYGYLDDYDSISAFAEEATQRCDELGQYAFQNRVPPPPSPPSPALPSISEEPPSSIFVEYHPKSSFIFGRGSNTFERIQNNEFARIREVNPYYPFKGRKEWELASFLATSSLSQSEIDEYLKLDWVKEQSPTFTSAHAHRSLIESLPDPPRWFCQEIVIEGYTSQRPICFYWRDALEVIEYTFGNPIFAPHMQFDPHRLWTDELRSDRIYSEYMTGDFSWQAQDNFPIGATQLAVVGASDKTCVTAMTGGLEMYPAYLTLANIRSAVRMKASNHAWSCFAFLPIVKFEVHSDYQSILSARLWHLCMDKAFLRCKAAARDGCYMTDPSGSIRKAFPLLAAWIADLPEQHLISATANNTSPLSHATTSQFGDDVCQPPRHGHKTLQEIYKLSRHVDPWHLGDFQKAAKTIGLSGVHMPFWRDWPQADPVHFLVPEILHTCHKFFYDHPLQWCINAVGSFELDRRFESLHSRVGFRHFGNGITHVKQMTGREYRDIQRSIVAVIAGAVPPPFLRAIRALVDFIYQVQAPLLTDTSISWFVDALREFHDEKNAIIDAGARLGSKTTIDHFNIPKLEIWHHFAQSTRAMGAPIQWTADVTERLHITKVKTVFRASNHRDFEEQCARSLDRSERVHLFNLLCSFASQDKSLAPLASLSAIQDKRILGSRRPKKNHFLKGFLSLNFRAAFHLNQAPIFASLSLEQAADLYALPDFWPALGDFTGRLSYQQRRGRRVARGRPDVGFNHIRVWNHFKIQLRSVHDDQEITPPQTVQALPPSTGTPHGVCDAVLIHAPEGAEDESVQGSQVAQVRMVFQPIPRERSTDQPPVLLYVEKFAFVGRRAENGTRLEEEGVDMYLLRRQFRSQVLSNGQRVRMGDIVPISNVARIVDLVPVFGARKDPQITANNTLEYPTDFYLNNFSDKETYQTVLREFT